MTNEERKHKRAKRRNRAAALLSANPAHIRAKTEKPKKGMGSYVRRWKHRYQEAF